MPITVALFLDNLKHNSSAAAANINNNLVFYGSQIGKHYSFFDYFEEAEEL